MARKAKIQQDKEFNQQMSKVIIILILATLLIIAIMKLGMVGTFLNHLFVYILGFRFSLIIALIMLYFVLSFLIRKGAIKKKNLSPLLIWSVIVLIFETYKITHIEQNGGDVFKQFLAATNSFFTLEPSVPSGGGLIGYSLYAILSILFARTGVFLVLILLVIISILLMTGIDIYKKAWCSIYHFFVLPTKEKEPVEEEKEKKEPLNIWQMIDEHKEAKMKDIRVDDITEEMNTLPDDHLSPFGLDMEETQELDTNLKTTNLTDEKLSDLPLKKQFADQKLGNYKLPSISLLDPLSSKDKNFENIHSAKEKAETLIAILHNFDIDAQLIDTHIGPSVTQFEIRPDPNVKVSKILSLADNLKMQMAAKDIRIEAPIPGHNAVGIEIPNVKSSVVKMRELVRDLPAGTKPLIFFLGKDLLGNAVYCDLAKMPHLLIAGATGSGKSVCMNTIITSYLLRTRPDVVKLLLIDPKKVEFTPYREIPHLIGPVINDPNKASNALKIMVEEMDRRYNMFASIGVRKLEDYNNLVNKEKEKHLNDDKAMASSLPYIVIIVDELADLMTVAGKDVEASIMRITQLGRAAGIHMIVATQRPSVDVITGVIKANIPSRIAFSVSSAIDSRTILDHQGAERLLGNGDMLYLANGSNSIRRVQGIYVSDDEVHRLTKACANQAMPLYDDAFLRLDMNDNMAEGAIMTMEDDPLFKEVTDYVIEAQKASTSLLQRRFGIGYNRAARMIDVLEDHGVIGPSRGSRPREVLKKAQDKIEKSKNE